jgi:hypothetical protein
MSKVTTSSVFSWSAALLSTLTLSTIAFGADFSAADGAFAQRTDATQRASAEQLYTAALPGLTGADRLYAIEQLSRLGYYEGSLPAESDSSNRKIGFQKCMDAADLASPALQGEETVAYHYWKGTCLASWAKANGVLKSLEKAGEVLGHIEKGNAIDPTYEGGGFYRLGSAVYLNLPAIFGGDLNKAADFSQKAISSAAYSGSLTPETDTGNYFYLVYLYAAQIAAKKEGKAEAIAIGKQALSRINDAKEIPAGREPETELNRRDLQEYLDSLN